MLELKLPKNAKRELSTFYSMFPFSLQQFSLNEELDPQLQESLATTKQWKKMKLKKERDAGIITDEEAFLFFVGAFDENQDDAEKVTIKEELVMIILV